jgi:DeoR/GlpR family transcriptional regulator of sugar metabolism
MMAMNAGPPGADVDGSQSKCTYTEYQWGTREAAKRVIAKFVVGPARGRGLIPPRSAVLLDAGSTVGWVAREIFLRERDECLGLTLMTNNMSIFNDFNQEDGPGNFAPPRDNSLALLLTGGRYDKQHDALFGAQARRGIDPFNPHVVVIATSGFTLSEGGGLYYHGHTEEEVVKTALWEKETDHRIIVCDHAKVGRKDSFLGGKIDHLMRGADRCTIVTTAPEYEDEVHDEPGGAQAVDEARKRREARIAKFGQRFEEQAKAFDKLYQRLKEEPQGKHAGPAGHARTLRHGRAGEQPDAEQGMRDAYEPRLALVQLHPTRDPRFLGCADLWDSQS